MMRRLAGLLAVAALGACAAAPKDHTKLVAAQLRSVLIVPVMNQSVDVTAPDYFLSTVPIPVAERGYYVFPVNLVKRLLEDDGLADPGLVHAADPVRLASIFGADAVLYVTIERWDAKWILVQTNVTVEFSYVLKDAHTGETLWAERQKMAYTSGDGGGGLIGAIIGAAIAKAAPDYMPLARRANGTALAFPGPGFPAGPFHPEHGRDWVPPAGGAVATAATAPPPASAPAKSATTTPAAVTTPAATAVPAPKVTPVPAAKATAVPAAKATTVPAAKATTVPAAKATTVTAPKATAVPAAKAPAVTTPAATAVPAAVNR